jgi:hypothetical protein
LALAVCDEYAPTAALTLALPGDTLLEEAPAQIGVDQAALGASDGVHQSVVRDAFRLYKSRNAPRQKPAFSPHSMNYHA